MPTLYNNYCTCLVPIILHKVCYKIRYPSRKLTHWPELRLNIWYTFTWFSGLSALSLFFRAMICICFYNNITHGILTSFVADNPVLSVEYNIQIHPSPNYMCNSTYTLKCTMSCIYHHLSQPLTVIVGDLALRPLRNISIISLSAIHHPTAYPII